MLRPAISRYTRVGRSRAGYARTGFRTSPGLRHLDDPAWTALPARLAQLSPDFARFWASSDVAGPERRLKRFRHPSAGSLTFHSPSLLMADDPMIRIVILHPATASDAAKLARLAR